jgi:hypothetical protein
MNGWVYSSLSLAQGVEEPMFSMDGNPVGSGTQAKEAQPKVELPLWEEREI